jgi:hypothetical protein
MGCPEIRTRLWGRGSPPIACANFIDQTDTNYTSAPASKANLFPYQIPQLDSTHHRMLMTILAPEMPLTCVSK